VSVESSADHQQLLISASLICELEDQLGTLRKLLFLANDAGVVMQWNPVEGIVLQQNAQRKALLSFPNALGRKGGMNE
jgi:hypothetical protein